MTRSTFRMGVAPGVGGTLYNGRWSGGLSSEPGVKTRHHQTMIIRRIRRHHELINPQASAIGVLGGGYCENTAQSFTSFSTLMRIDKCQEPTRLT